MTVSVSDVLGPTAMMLPATAFSISIPPFLIKAILPRGTRHVNMASPSGGHSFGGSFGDSRMTFAFFGSDVGSGARVSWVASGLAKGKCRTSRMSKFSLGRLAFAVSVCSEAARNRGALFPADVRLPSRDYRPSPPRA